MVILLARWLTGREDVTATEFVQWLQRHACIPERVKIQGVDMPLLRAFCSAKKWQQRPVYTIHPFNSPVVVLYWRVMLSLLRHLCQANRTTVAMDGYTGHKSPTYDLVCQMNWKFMASTIVVEPVVAKTKEYVQVVREVGVIASTIVVEPVVAKARKSVPAVRKVVKTQEPVTEEPNATGSVKKTVAVAEASTLTEEFLVVLAVQQHKENGNCCPES